MKTRKQIADACAKRAQKARDEVAKVLLAAEVLTGDENAEEARAYLATAILQLDVAIGELGRLDPRGEAADARKVAK